MSGRGIREQRKPHHGGCLIRKGTHWARDCSTATVEQKKNIGKNVA